MAQELRLQTNHNPSMFNKDMLLGGLLGSLAPVGFIAPGIGPMLGLSALVIVAGGAIGGFMGKKQQESENSYGKRVGEPSLWNKDMLLGGLLGLVAGKITAISAGIASIGGVLLTSTPGAGLAVAGAGLAAMGISLIAGPVLGAWIGGKMGQRRMAGEYEQAKKEQILGHVSRNMSPEVAHAVEYTMDHKKDWGTKVMEEQLLAAAQEQGR